MIKVALVAIWISAATLGAVFYSFQSTQARQGEDPAPPFFGGLDYITTEIISVPVAKEGSVYGYFLARLVYTVEPKKLKQLTIPARILFVDEIYSYLYGNPQIDWSAQRKVDLEAFKTGIRDSINERVGDTLIHQVLIEQLDFLTKAEIRDNTIRRRTPPPDGETEAAPDPAPASH